MTARRAFGTFQQGDDILAMVEDVAKVGHWRFDVQTRALDWSDAVYRLHGVDPDSFELTIERALAFYHPEDVPGVRAILDDTLATGRPFAFDRRIVTAHGDVRHVYCRGVCEHDGADAVTSLFGTVMDISALKLAEQTGRESEMRFRLLAESTSDVITRLDADFRREYVSPACIRLFGFTPEEMTGTIPSDTIHPDDRDSVQASAQQLIGGEIASGRVTNTYRTLHKDGRWIWVEAGMSLAREGADGERVVLICSLRDVTERKSAEAALKASEARLRAVAENTNELIIVGYDDGSRSYISPASTRLLGYTPDELMKMRVRDYVHPDDIPRLYETTSQLGKGATEVSIVYRARTKAGVYIWAEGIFRRIDGAQPGEPSIVSTYRDVTDSKTQAEALKGAMALSERERAAAELASEAKTDFLAAMSHEIRTPLNAVIGYTEILSGSTLDNQQRKHLDRIRTSSAALLTVVNDILDFSKIEAGEIELEAAPFSLAALVDATISIISGQAAAKRLSLEANVAESLPSCFVGDEARLRQVLLNLLNNAVKFTASGRVSLAIEGRTEGETARLTFEVRDTGIGIPEDRRDRLFARFSQVDGSIQREFGGTGLGLAICKRLIELMGGTIRYDPAPGGGSVFSFDVQVSCATQSTQDVPLAAEAQRPKPSRGARVLLVEDLEVNQDLARLVIESAGHRVDIARDGAEALAVLEAKTYDIVLMDVQMPGMDGMTATKLIRALPSQARHVPIVAMTANVMPAQIAKFKAAGMNAHIGKPFRPAELQALIECWTSRTSEAANCDRSTDEIDEAAYRELVDLLGEAAVHKVLGDLLIQLNERFSDERLSRVDRERLGHDAHTMLSAFAMAGFSRFSAICVRVDNACRDAAPLDHPLGELRLARSRVAEAIAARLKSGGS